MIFYLLAISALFFTCNADSHITQAEWEEAIRQGYVVLDDGWVSPFNGRKYKVIGASASWQESRSLCQRMGADLVVYEVGRGSCCAYDMEIRDILQRALSLSSYIWIGLSDIESEGDWQWVNGNKFSKNDQNCVFRSPEPDNYGNADCANTNFDVGNPNYLLADDGGCSGRRRQVVCEKMV